MNSTKIYDYNVKANYLNYNTLRYFIEDHPDFNLLNNYQQPEIEYIEAPHSQPKIIKAHFFDIPYLCDTDKEQGKIYLQHLLNLNEGIPGSIKIIEQSIKKYKSQKQEQLKNISFVENDFVVPSSTFKKYGEDEISQKGSILLDLIQRLFPVPDFCVLTSKTFFLSEQERNKHIINAIENLEKMTGSKLGDKVNPLIFAMRSATSFYIPGFLPTYLNVGINETVYNALKTKYGVVVAGKICINNLQTIYKTLFPQNTSMEFCNPITSYFSITDIDKKINALVEEISQKNKEILKDPYLQVSFFVNTINDFFLKNQDIIYTLRKGDISYPSIIMQKMVWTVRNDESYPGVLYSRHSRTGLGMQIESVRNMFGDDIMTGNIDRTDTEFVDREEIKNTFPAVYHFVPCLSKLEASLESPVTIEFAAETYKDTYLFAILQLNPSELTGRSTLLSSIDMYEHGVISGERVINLIQPYHLKQIFSERIDDKSFPKMTNFCKGISVLPRSAVTARIFFSASEAMKAKGKGEKVCLCKETFVPSDTIFLKELDAIISLTPAAVHVVTSCLGYGVPAFINLNKYQVKLLSSALINKDGQKINEGDWITLSSKYRNIYIGKASYAPARFQKYLEGKKLDLIEKEEKVFFNMKEAYKKYQTIIKSLDYGEIESLNDLIKIVRNDLQKNNEKAKNLANNWFDSNINLYIEQILKSELGAHQDQHMIYELFTIDRKVVFFKKIIKICKIQGIKGYTAGSFMLGRFICIQHPVEFWKKMDDDEIIFLLNEYILFEKYLQVLNDLGERHINRARKEILNEGISNVNLSHIEPTVFMTLKLFFKEWDSLKKNNSCDIDSETLYLIDLLKKPFGYFYEYKSEWSIGRLQEICNKEKLPLPNEDTI
ncbi:MAG TPA: hypothetical protein PKK00_04805 [Bacteroidales bacterium]|nr:hypothetical protein [Bacteroidales bacterium]HPS16785.1 hypothetical protein [Bacteroidales bacterium]